jgi:hypothetical protein
MKRIAITILLSAYAASGALAAGLECAGIAGNSGGEGEAIVRTSVARSGGGVVVDASGRIFTGGGDRVLVLSPDGKRLGETPLPEKDWVLGGPNFAADGKFLYFIAGKPLPYEGLDTLLVCPWTLVEPNLCRMEMAPDAKAQVVWARERFVWQPTWIRQEISLAASPKGGKVYLGYGTSWNREGKFAVSEIGPAGTPSPLFEADVKGGRMSVDEDGNFYLGGDGQVRKVDRTGKAVAGFVPVGLPGLGTAPTNFRGAVMLTAGALWDYGHFGFLGRYTRQFKAAPGLVAEWAHALSWVAQVADGPDGTLYVKSNDALYVCKLVDDKLVRLKRFGSLPRVLGLVVTPEGRIGAGADTSSGLAWYDFAADSPAAAPVRSEYPGPITPVFADRQFGLVGYGLQPSWLTRDHVPPPLDICLLRFGTEPMKPDRQESQSLVQGRVASIPVAATRASTYYFTSDASGMSVLRAPLGVPCTFSPVAGVEATEGHTVTSLAGLGRSHLVIALGNRLCGCEVKAAGGLKDAWEIRRSADGPDGSFGNELYVAAADNRLLVADTQRHRVLLFAFGDNVGEAPQFIAQFGQTDREGDDLGHLRLPTLMSLAGEKAVVYDSGNQRIVKLRIK